MICYRRRKYNDLTRDDLIKLRRLTIRYGSGFRDMMDGRGASLDKTRVVIARDTVADKYVGWSVGTYLREGKVQVGVFVSWKYRRRGIATKLIRKLVKAMEAREARCFMHDKLSYNFYAGKFGAWRTRQFDAEGQYGPSLFRVKA